MIAGVQLFNVLSPLVGDTYLEKTQYLDRALYIDDGNKKIYPIIARENDDATVPYIIYQTVSSQPEVTNDGITGYEWVRMQIDVYHTDAYKATILANKVINAINEQIKPSIYDGQQQLYDHASGLYRQSIDYSFFQTTPTE